MTIVPLWESGVFVYSHQHARSLAVNIPAVLSHGLTRTRCARTRSHTDPFSVPLYTLSFHRSIRDHGE